MVCGGLAGMATIAVIVAAITASMYAGGMALAYADSPLEQWREGVEPKDVQCKDGLYLTVTPSHKPACITKEAAYVMEGRGWGSFIGSGSAPAKATIIRDTMPVIEEIHYWPWYDVELRPWMSEESFDCADSYRPMPVDSKPRPELAWAQSGTGPPSWVDLSTKPAITNIGRGLGPGDEAFWPQYIMEFPHVGMAYERFELPYNYSYIVPGEGGDYDNPKYQCPREQCEGQYLEVQTSSFVRLLNKDAELLLQATDTTRDGFHYNVHRMPLPFDNTKPMQVMLEFLVAFPFVHEPSTYDLVGMVYPRVHDTGDAMYLRVFPHHGLVAYDPTLGSKTPDRAWFASTTPAERDGITRAVQNGLVWSEGQSGPPIEVVRRPPDPAAPIDGVEQESYLYLAVMLKENFPDGDYEQMFLDSNLKQEWIDDFFKAWPSMR